MGDPEKEFGRKFYFIFYMGEVTDIYFHTQMHVFMYTLQII